MRTEQLYYYVKVLVGNNCTQGLRELSDYFTEQAGVLVKKQKVLELEQMVVINGLITECGRCKQHLHKLLLNELSTKLDDSIAIEEVIERTNNKALVNSYYAVIRLLATLTEDVNMSPKDKLCYFKREYNTSETREGLFYSNENVIIRFLREINYQLSNIFIFDRLGLEVFFTPAQKIRKQMESPSWTAKTSLVLN